MAQSSFRKSQLVEFKNTAAGHDGVLSDPSGSCIIKPCKQSEIDFYESIHPHSELGRFIPRFMGSLSLTDPKDPAQFTAALIQQLENNGQVNVHNGISEPIAVDNGWTPSNGGRIETNCAIAMENVADGYRKSNILDVKLGARLWADDAPPAKRAKLDNVAGETTSKALGFRVAGMRIWQGEQAAGQSGVDEDLYKSYDKNYGRALTAETVVQGFEDYFRIIRSKRPVGNMMTVIRRFIDDLEELQGILEREESRMYSASLLFVYEGDPEALEEAISAENQNLATFAALEERHPDCDGRDPKAVDGGTSHSDTSNMKGGLASSSSNGESAALDGTVDDSEDSSELEEEEEEEEEELPKIQDLKLIDFAHATWTPGQGPDENLLHGIRNVIRTLNELYKRPILKKTP
ncbi:MAG: hypothetical protein Q9195_007844 [Heterodermia aff. obscurata]